MRGKWGIGRIFISLQLSEEESEYIEEIYVKERKEDDDVLWIIEKKDIWKEKGGEEIERTEVRKKYKTNVHEICEEEFIEERFKLLMNLILKKYKFEGIKKFRTILEGEGERAILIRCGKQRIFGHFITYRREVERLGEWADLNYEIKSFPKRKRFIFPLEEIKVEG